MVLDPGNMRLEIMQKTVIDEWYQWYSRLAPGPPQELLAAELRAGASHLNRGAPSVLTP